jgi:hypothetical protein
LQRNTPAGPSEAAGVFREAGPGSRLLTAGTRARTASGEASDFLGDRGQPGLRGGDDPVPVLVRFLVGDDRRDR